jgi:hypothetical protein
MKKTIHKPKKTTKEITNNIIEELQTNLVMAMLEQGLVKEAESKLEEFGVPKKVTQNIFRSDQYIKKMKEKNYATRK